MKLVNEAEREYEGITDNRMKDEQLEVAVKALHVIAVMNEGSSSPISTIAIDALKEMLLSVFNNKVNFDYNKQITLNATKISEEVRKKIYPKALVVGGGIFGTTAAITLAHNGYNVELHEKLKDIMR